MKRPPSDEAATTSSGSSSTSPATSSEVRDRFGLHELAIEDAFQAQQRPKVEPYDDFYFIVYK